MAETPALPEPPDLTETVFKALEDKASLPTGSMIVLGMLAGAFIGLGGMFATIALSGGDELSFGAGQVLAGLVFTLGLVLVLIAGAELFTGNTLMAGPVAAGRVSMGKALKALAIVYFANFAGALLLAGVIFAAGVHEGGDGAVGLSALELGTSKTGRDFLPTLASGVIANMLVCLAVWMAFGGHTVTEKIMAMILPIAAFVAAGLEHSVANMYLLPYAYLVQGTISSAAGTMSFADMAGNLIPATIGNMIGGSIIALAYGWVYPVRQRKGDQPG
ncbi:formate transporter FocA [Altererythrobacter xixiisoli]|uniref:Formate transporter FocA n=1 Tax=Croceibacterium xixiisoli TaxID=1476466 RepID=A0A6I4U0F1_9SPHN|nr:formate/nitrite transporter family protein [Croceibacterium xixiisoli]MXP00428.1 formate transporter FocA [Croceibacterium xixiisoli]